MFDELALEAWLTIDTCYLIGWDQKKLPAGIHSVMTRWRAVRNCRPAVFAMVPLTVHSDARLRFRAHFRKTGAPPALQI